MFTLYQTFIQQIKQEQIQRYNQRHKEYLYRCGKLKQESTIRNNYKKPQNIRTNKQDQNVSQARKTSLNFVPQEIERPLKNQNRSKITENLNNQHKRDQVKPQMIINRAQKIPKPLYQIKAEKNNQIRVQESTLNEKNIQSLSIQKFIEPLNNQPKQKVNFQQLEEVQEVELVQCPQGCGRKFNPKALDKHVKICQKGEVKRKVFKVKVVDQEAEKLKKDEPVELQKKNKIPKWKKESNQIRNMVKKMESLNQGNQNVQTQKLPQPEQEDDRKLCPGCGRKFNQKAAQKHIPSCVKRNKDKMSK